MKKFVILMILILTQQTVLSQQVVIDTLNKTITLSREKKIDVAKIIENEKSLFEENEILKQANLKLEEMNKSLASDLEILRKEVSDKKDAVINFQNKIIENKDKISDIKDNKDYGLYLQSGFTTEQFGGFSIGGAYVKEKLFFGASFNPKTEDRKVNSFTINLGIKLF